MKSFVKFFIFSLILFSSAIANNKDILIIGTGYVGLVSGTCFAKMNNKVICLDIDNDKIAKLQSNIIPIYEPGLKELVEQNRKNNRLEFTNNYHYGIKNSSIIFICVPTPSNADGSCDTSFVENVAKEIGKNIDSYKIIVIKSTVPVGTCQIVKQLIQNEINKRGENISFDVAFNPEFLKEGCAINDCLYPDRIIIGCESKKATDELIELGTDFTNNILTMDIKSAELTKYVANAMLALRVSFMNEVANICKNTGANINNVKKGISEDKRIGKYFLNAGIGYGGSCFPKDVKSLSHIAKQAKVEPVIIDAIDSVNERQKIIFAKYIENYFATFDTLANKTLAIWGLAFKPNTDDMRSAPSLGIIEYLLKKGATLKLYDPIAMDNAKKLIAPSENIYWAYDPIDCATNTDGIVLITEWDDFKNIDLLDLKSKMRSYNIFDGRILFDFNQVHKKGFNYIGIGLKNNYLE